MAESFAELFEQSQIESKMRPGPIVKGTVVEIRADFVVVNAGLKSEGVIPAEQFRNPEGEVEVTVGEEIDVALDAVEDGYGETRLSREKAKRAKAWEELEEACEESKTVTGVISDGAKGAVGLALNQLKRSDGSSIVHALCSRHIMENANKAKVQHPTTGDLVKVNATKDDKDLAWQIIKGTNKSEVQRDLGNLRHQNPPFYTWLTDKNRLPKCALLGHALNGF